MRHHNATTCYIYVHIRGKTTDKPSKIADSRKKKKIVMRSVKAENQQQQQQQQCERH